MKSFLLLLSLVLFSTNAISKDLSNRQISHSYHKSYDYEKSGNLTDAIKALLLIYQQYPATYTVNYRLAYLYSSNHNYNNAIDHYKAAIKALPNSFEPKIGIMLTYLLAKKYTEATKMGYQIISIDYYNYYGNLHLAHILRITDKLDLAEKINLKMLAVYPTDISYLAELGLLNLAQKKPTEATAIFNSILVLDPENTIAKSSLFAIKK